LKTHLREAIPTIIFQTNIQTTYITIIFDAIKMSDTEPNDCFKEYYKPDIIDEKAAMKYFTNSLRGLAFYKFIFSLRNLNFRLPLLIV